MIDYMKCDLDDIVFEHRNRAYGSYSLRKSYGKNMKRAAVGGVAVFLLLISSPLIADRMKPEKLLLEEKTVTLMDAPKEDIKKPDIPPPPPPPPPPVKKIETLRFVPPVVTEKAETEPLVITPPDPNVNIGTKNIEGEKTTTYTPPIEVVAPVAPPIETPKEVKKVDEDIPFVIVEQNPEFQDGVKAMYQFLSNNIKYPAIARENAIEGTVYVGFVVGKDGSIRDVAVKRGIGGGCNEEAVRVVKLMPNWKPGKQQGKPVSVAYTIPIKFHLD